MYRGQAFKRTSSTPLGEQPTTMALPIKIIAFNHFLSLFILRSKYFRGKKIHGEFDIRVEQVKDLNLNSISEKSHIGSSSSETEVQFHGTALANHFALYDHRVWCKVLMRPIS